MSTTTISRRLVTLVETIRVGPCLCILATLAAGLALPLSYVNVTNGALTVVVVLLGFTHVNLYNYFTDEGEDRSNDRYNPVVDDTKARLLRAYVVASAVLVVVISWQWLPRVTFGLSVAGLVLGLCYSHRWFRFKERLLVKNLTIGVGYGMVLLIFRSGLQGGLADLDLVLATFYAFFSVTGSTTRDVFDVEGDREAGVDTVPVRFGLPGTGAFLAAMAALQIGTVVAAVGLGRVDPVYLSLCLVAPFRLKRPYYLRQGTPENLDPKAIPGIVAASTILIVFAHVL